MWIWRVVIGHRIRKGRNVWMIANRRYFFFSIVFGSLDGWNVSTSLIDLSNLGSRHGFLSRAQMHYFMNVPHMLKHQTLPSVVICVWLFGILIMTRLSTFLWYWNNKRISSAFQIRYRMSGSLSCQFALPSHTNPMRVSLFPMNITYSMSLLNML